MRFFKLLVVWVLSLGSLISAGLLVYIALVIRPDLELLNVWLLAAAALALIFTLIANPITSGAFGFNGRVVPTTLMQIFLIVLGAAALYFAYQFETVTVAEKQKEARREAAPAQYQEALSYCKAAFNAEVDSISFSRNTVNCEGWLIRVTSNSEHYTDLEVAILRVWKSLVSLKKKDSARWSKSDLAADLERCEKGSSAACYSVGRAVNSGLPEGEIDSLARPFLEAGCADDSTRNLCAYL